MKLKQKIKQYSNKIKKPDFSKAKRFLIKNKVTAALVAVVVVLAVGFMLNPFSREDSVTLKGAAPSESLTLKEAVIANNEAIHALATKVSQMEARAQGDRELMDAVKGVVCNPK